MVSHFHFDYPYKLLTEGIIIHDSIAGVQLMQAFKRKLAKLFDVSFDDITQEIEKLKENHSIKIELTNVKGRIVIGSVVLALTWLILEEMKPDKRDFKDTWNFVQSLHQNCNQYSVKDPKKYQGCATRVLGSMNESEVSTRTLLTFAKIAQRLI